MGFKVIPNVFLMTRAKEKSKKCVGEGNANCSPECRLGILVSHL